MRNCVQCASNFLTNVRLDSPRAISFRSALRRTGRRARANWTLTIASLCRRRSSVPASLLLGARPSDLGMRYTSNDAPRGITSIAARHGTTGVYMRVPLCASYERAGRVAGQPADQRRVTFTRSCSLLLARARRPLDAPLPSLEAPLKPCSPRWRGRSPSSAWHRPLPRLAPSLPAPRDLILITILLFLSSELQLRQLRKRRSPTRRFTFHPLLFHFVFFSLSLSVSFSLFLSPSSGKRSFSRSMRSPTGRARARARDAKDARFNCDF